MPKRIKPATAKRRLKTSRDIKHVAGGRLTAEECRYVQIRDKVYMSWLRWGQDTAMISKDIDLPIETVEAVVKTFAKNKNTEVAWMISQEILQEINKGHQARLQHIKDAISDLRPHLIEKLSVCCNATTFDVVGAPHCAVCGKLCHVASRVNNENMERYNHWIDQWQDLDSKLVSMIASLGFAKPNSPLASLVMNALHLHREVETKPNATQDEKDKIVVLETQLTSEFQKEFSNMAPQELENALKTFEVCFSKQHAMIVSEDAPMDVPESAKFDVSEILNEIDEEGADDGEPN